MTVTTLLFLPIDERQPWRWWRVADAAIVAEGEGVPDATAALVAIAPAEAVTLHWADLPARSAAQAFAAARVVVSDATAVPVAGLHVADGEADPAGRERPVAVVSPERMTHWLAVLARAGLDPVAIVPAPLLLPVPDEGYVRADLPHQSAVRGRTSGWADDPALTALITGDAPPLPVDAEALRASVVATAGWPPLDLRQGPFARRTRRTIDWALVRRLAVLAGLVLLATLAIDLVRIARYSFGAATLEARADMLARQGLPRGTGDGDAPRMLADRLSRLRGPGAGFSRTAAAAYRIVEAVPDSEVTAMRFDPDGRLTLSLSLAGEGQANTVKSRLEAAGFAVEAGVFAATNGRLSGDMTVTP